MSTIEAQSNIVHVHTPNEQDALNENENKEKEQEPKEEKPPFPDTDSNVNKEVNIDIKGEDNEKEEEEEESLLSENELAFLNNVIKCCEDDNNIDAYQVMAFDNNTRENWKDGIKYALNIIKCVLCALTQIFGIIIIMAEVVKLGLQEKTWCNIPSLEHETVIQLIFEADLKILAFLFSSFLAYFSIDSLTSVGKGMYFKMKYAERIKWVNTTWLRVGFTVNLFVSIIAVYGAFLVIFFSDNSLDMVLNSVALFFIIELDDLLVKDSDYERIQSHIEQYENRDLMVKKMLIEDEVNKCKYCCFVCGGKFGQCINWFVAVPFTIIQYVTLVFCFICPGLILVCY